MTATQPAYSVNHGTVEHDGRTIRLTEEATNTNRAGGPPQYAARGVDDQGNEYVATWDVKPEFFEMDELNEHARWKSAAELGYEPEEADMCDWDTPAAVERV